MLLTNLSIISQNSQRITPKTNLKKQEYSNKKQSQNITNTFKSYAYRDYNISFCGRTPENFYQQDFNRENMPSSMKNYLNYDYVQRQHIPPEQMMHEVFKYIEDAKDFDEVKKLYPNEELFQKLHQNKIKSRTGILSEIRIAKELSDTPLLKDGSDDFGMYLLKKIYSEGKTLKEISKDFLEKDINNEYKDFITEPIDYSTTSAFGIQFPNNAFWHSFISTRDEYKKFFVTLPKNTVDPNRINSGSTHSSKISDKGDLTSDQTPQKPKERKFKIKTHQKRLIKTDIKDSNGNIEVMKKKVTRRFSKEDPEASFITKYWSPIMAIAAEKSHLSEELKYFNEQEKIKGKTSDDKYMLSRFWKTNPLVVEDFSKAIPDAIELFEETYEAGGLIPINSEFEPISTTTKNQKAIDFVTPEFIELLTYTQNIEQKRNARYENHEKLQAEWEKHFLERYGEVNAEETPQAQTNNKNSEQISTKSTEFTTIVTESNNEKKMLLTIEKNFRDRLNKAAEYFPTQYAKEQTKILLSRPEFDEKYKLSIAPEDIIDKLEAQEVFSNDEIEELRENAINNSYVQNINKSLCASFAMADTIISHLNLKECPQLYRLMPYQFSSLMKMNDDIFKNFEKTLRENKKEIDHKYNKYTSPLSNKEIKTISKVITEGILNFDENREIKNSDTKTILIMIQEALKNSEPKKGLMMNTVIPEWVSKKTFTRTLIDKKHQDSEGIKDIHFDITANFFVRDILQPYFLAIVGRKIINKYKNKLSPEIQSQLLNAEKNLSIDEQLFYNKL